MHAYKKFHDTVKTIGRKNFFLFFFKNLLSFKLIFMRVFYLAFIWVLTSLNFSYFILSMILLPVGSNVQEVISFALISHRHDFLLVILFSSGACTSLASGPSQIYIAFLFKSYHLFVYFCLPRVFFAVHGLSLVAAS